MVKENHLPNHPGRGYVSSQEYIYIYIDIYIYRERDSFRFCLEWLYQRSFTWNTHVNLQSARWKKWWHRHLVSQCWEPIILLVVSTCQFATALQHLRLSENRVVEMTGNHQVKKSSGIPTHQTIKNKSAMNSAMVFPIPKKTQRQQPFPLQHFSSHTYVRCTFLFSTPRNRPPLLLVFLGDPEAAVDSLGQLSTLEIAHAAFAEARSCWRSCGPVLGSGRILTAGPRGFPIFFPMIPDRTLRKPMN